MYRTILVPLDGSPLAERALPYAEALARASGARLLLVRAALAHTFPGVDPTEDQVKAVREAEDYLATIAAQLARQGVVETAVFYGEPVEAILEETRLRKADLVVMATHGRSGVSRWVYGSVAEAVLAESPVPVLLVQAWRDEGKLAPLAEHPRLIVPLDGSPFAEEVLPVALEVAGKLGGELVLLHVVSVSGQAVAAGRQPAGLEALKDEARDYLRQVADRLATSDAGLRVQYEVRVGPAAEAIVAASHDLDASLVVMATHARTGLDRILLGSVAQGVLRHGSIPVLLVHPRGLDRVWTQVADLVGQEPAQEARVSLTLDRDEIELLQTALQAVEPTVPEQDPLRQRIGRLLERLSRPQGADRSYLPLADKAGVGQWPPRYY